MQKVWNEKRFDIITIYLVRVETIQFDISSPSERQTLNHESFQKD